MKPTREDEIGLVMVTKHWATCDSGIGMMARRQRSSYVNQINFGAKVDLIDSP
jgi:hypothetical protein